MIRLWLEETLSAQAAELAALGGMDHHFMLVLTHRHQQRSMAKSLQNRDLSVQPTT